MHTAEVAADAGVHVETLRYYERRGLLPVPPRQASGYRDYRAEDVRRVRFIKRAQAVGFSLTEIGALLALADGEPANGDAARVLAEAKIAQLERKIADLAAMRDALREVVRTCQTSPGERCCPLLDNLGDPSAD